MDTGDAALPDARCELRLPRAALDRMRQDCVARWPHEACGLLLGTGAGRRRRVRWVAPARNVHPDPRRGFAIAPLDALRIERAAVASAAGRDQPGLAVLGVYHSHPDGSAQPSETDRADAVAVWPSDRPSWSYVIVALPRGRMADVRSFVLRDGRFCEERLCIEEAAVGAAAARNAAVDAAADAPRQVRHPRPEVRS